YLGEGEWRERLETSSRAGLTPFSVPETDTLDVGARGGRNFAAERAEPGANVFEALGTHVLALQAGGKPVAIALWSEGARDRMSHVLADHKLHNLRSIDNWPQVLALPKPAVALVVLGIESGFETEDAAIISEQDILGDRLVRPRRATRRAANFIAEATSLAPGDLVVHVDPGIGPFPGLPAPQAPR